MDHKYTKKPVILDYRFFLFLWVLLVNMNSFAQIGFVIAPYFITPNYGTTAYGDAHDKIGNNQSIGGLLHLNIARRFCINFTHFEFASDYLGNAHPSRLGYGVGARPVYDYLPLKNDELNIAYFFKIKELSGTQFLWGGNNLYRAIGVRTGAILNQRLVKIKPQKVNFWHEVDGNNVQDYDYISWYDVTGLKQQLIFGGLEINKYKSEEQYRNIFDRDQVQIRKRMYQKYADLLFVAHQSYANYGVDSFAFSGNNIPNLQSFGWRVGLRRITFNHLAHSFVCEFGQYPGQKRIPDTGANGIEVDQNYWKNWFVFVGFNLCIGHWFGEYE